MEEGKVLIEISDEYADWIEDYRMNHQETETIKCRDENSRIWYDESVAHMLSIITMIIESNGICFASSLWAVENCNTLLTLTIKLIHLKFRQDDVSWIKRI